MKREEKKQRRREDLLLAAQKVFSEKGYHDTGVADIVREAGVAHGTFYTYFKSKREAFETIIDRLVNDFYQTFSTFPLREIKTKEDYEKKQRILAKKAVKVVIDRRDMAKIFFWESIGLDGKLNKKIINIQDRFIELSSIFIRYGISKGIVRKDIDPIASARFVVGGFWNLAFRWALEGYSERSVLRQINKILDDHFYGIFYPDYSHRL